MKFARLAVPLLALAVFTAFGVVVLSMAEVGADLVFEVLNVLTTLDG
jgi:amino acid permease